MAVVRATKPTTGFSEADGNVWKLEEAKARFSEVVRRAQAIGPQRVTVRGEPAVVIIDAAELERIAPSADRPSLIEFLETLGLGDLDLTREPDAGRDVDL
jgi:prevent-host-death family protein